MTLLLGDRLLKSLAEQAFGTRRPCHRQYISCSHRLSNKSSHDNLMHWESVTPRGGRKHASPMKMWLTGPIVSCMRIGLLRKQRFRPYYLLPTGSVYVRTIWMGEDWFSSVSPVGAELLHDAPNNPFRFGMLGSMGLPLIHVITQPIYRKYGTMHE